jgi:hypothetical protein
MAMSGETCCASPNCFASRSLSGQESSSHRPASNAIEGDGDGRRRDAHTTLPAGNAPVGPVGRAFLHHATCVAPFSGSQAAARFLRGTAEAFLQLHRKPAATGRGRAQSAGRPVETVEHALRPFAVGGRAGQQGRGRGPWWSLLPASPGR